MKKKLYIYILIAFFCCFVLALIYAVFIRKVFLKINVESESIERFISDRQAEEMKDDNSSDPFGEDGIARILLMGLDKRVGETAGHCDAIQLITIDKEKQNVVITAVPRGTYSSLPPGKAATSTDYYVSNACALGGLEYGVKQIEKILGEKADYLVVVGFSETLGILRNLKLPTISTLQWLRQRHVYAIGEPQRAHDHSTFLKYLLMNYVSREYSQIDKIKQYIIYKMIKTDLFFAETQALAKELSLMDLANHPERIELTMRPAYDLKDIQYDPNKLEEYLNITMGRIENNLSENDYSGISLAEMQAKLLETIDYNKDDLDFVNWVIENNLWLQIEDKEKRLSVQFDFLKKYVETVLDKEIREVLISDYILEMGQLGEVEWAKKGKELLNEKL